jgi:hypothetical protein
VFVSGPQACTRGEGHRNRFWAYPGIVSEQKDLDLLRKAERALSEIDRTTGLDDRHADVLAALRIRIEGGPRRSLEDLMAATGDIEGKRSRELEERLRESERSDAGDLGDLLRSDPAGKKKRSLDDLL